MKVEVSQAKRFTDYVYSFYGVDGLYPMTPELTHEDIIRATAILEQQYAEQSEYNVEYDSIDRERVRDILLDKMNYEIA